MSAFAARTADFRDAPRLRLLPARGSWASAPSADAVHQEGAARLTLHAVPAPTAEQHPVLVAGGHPGDRAAVLRDLTETMPPGTIFAEAEAFWEVLVRAPSSSMVILSGELDELPPESLMQMLAHRHPGLPVVSIDAPALSRAQGARL
jgi:hypothetical protein